MKIRWHQISNEKWAIVTDPCAVLCELHLLATSYEARCVGRSVTINEVTLEGAKAKTKRWFRNLIRELAVELEADEPK